MKQFRYILVALSVTVLASCGKRTEETKPVTKNVTEMVFASGVLEANNTYDLTAQTDGYLVMIDFKEGDIITEGTTVAEIRNVENAINNRSSEALYDIAKSNTKETAPAIAKAQSDVNLAEKKMELDSAQLSRYQTLYNKKSVSQSEYEKILLQYNTSRAEYLAAVKNYELAKQQARQELISTRASKNLNTTLLGNNRIKAVIGGKVYEKFKQKGDYVRKGEVIATIGDAEFLYAKVNVDESNIGKIKVGQQAVIQLNTQPNKKYKGKVAEILPAFDEASQSFICKLYFVDSLDFKIAGTQLQSNIIIGKKENALLIPRHYLNYDGTVTVKDRDEKVKVVTGFTGKEWVHIISGIDANTTLVTQDIKSEGDNTSELGSQMM